MDARKTAGDLMNTKVHLLEANSLAGEVVHHLRSDGYDDASLMILFDRSEVIGQISVGDLKTCIEDNPVLAFEMVGNLAHSDLAFCRASDSEERVEEVRAWNGSGGVILVLDAEERILGAIHSPGG